MDILSDVSDLSSDNLPACRYGVPGCSTDHTTDHPDAAGVLCAALIGAVSPRGGRTLLVRAQVFTDTAERAPTVTVLGGRAELFELDPVQARKLAGDLIYAAQRAERAVAR